MKRISIVICLAISLGGCFFDAAPPLSAVQPDDTSAHPSQPPADPSPTPTALPHPIGQEVQCKVEAKCLADLHGLASRAGKTLSLKLESGSTKRFTSTADCETVGESCVHTSLIGYLPSQQLFVLSEGGYESHNSLIVSRRTGDVFRIVDGVPHFSPDGKRFVVAAFDEQDGENQIAIYGTTAFPPVKEWSHLPGTLATGFEFVAWNGNDKIELREVIQKSAASVSHASAGWKLIAAGG